MLNRVRSFAADVDDSSGQRGSLGDGVLECSSTIEELLSGSLPGEQVPQIPALIEKRRVD